MSGYPPPLDSGRNPFELFVLGFSLVVGFPLLFGAPTPGSTTELLGPGLARVWGVILVLGCVTALTGVWWTWWAWAGRWFHRFKPLIGTGLLIEQVGLVAVGVGDVIYAWAVIEASHPPGARSPLVGAAIVGCFGLACWWRAWLIQRWVRATIREQESG